MAFLLLLLSAILSITLSPVVHSRDYVDVNAELECLAKNIYYEANLEGLRGRELVHEVVLYRIHSPYWPDTICEVVYQPWQYSWTMKEQEPIPYSRYVTMMQEASYLYENVKYPTLGADHYYAPASMIPVNRVPDWAVNRSPIKVHKGHKFYRITN